MHSVLRKSWPNVHVVGFPLFVAVSGCLAAMPSIVGQSTALITTATIGLALAGITCTLGVTHRTASDLPTISGTQLRVLASALHQASVGLMIGLVAVRVSGHLLDRTVGEPTRIDWIALGACVVASLICLRDRRTCFPLVALYALGLAGIGMELLVRGFTPARFYVWAGICELTGFLLVAALVGWAIPRWRFLRRWYRTPDDQAERCRQGFLAAQVILYAIAVLLTIHIALDPGYDRLGEGMAILGLDGRSASCPAALMLLGAAIVMAWQARGRVRAAWQYTALIAGLLFTTSIGWSSVDTSPATANGAATWLPYSECLLITASMMTFMTGFGLARFLPTRSDWIPQARRAMPAFACLAGLMLIVVLAILTFGRSS